MERILYFQNITQEALGVRKKHLRLSLYIAIIFCVLCLFSVRLSCFQAYYYDKRRMLTQGYRCVCVCACVRLCLFRAECGFPFLSLPSLTPSLSLCVFSAECVFLSLSRSLARSLLCVFLCVDGCVCVY